MRVIALEIPDDPAALAGWLERRMVGLDLAALAAELEAVHGPEPSSGARESLDAFLGDRLGAVLERGLSALPPEALRRLLRRPRLLLELQALVLSSGDAYWRRLAEASDDLRVPVERVRRRLAEITRPAAGSGSPREAPAWRPEARAAAWYRRPWFVSLATAAAILAAVVAFEQSRDRFEFAPVPTGWGWSRPGALPEASSPAAYLDRLADAAEDWFRDRPEEPVALARRIAEFRQGCSVLILAEHRPLSAEDRTWLINRCRAWAAKLDKHLADLEAGEDPPKVRDEADATIRKLIQSLRERAKLLF